MGIAEGDHSAVSTVFATAAPLTSFIMEREMERERSYYGSRSGKHLTRLLARPVYQPLSALVRPPTIRPRPSFRGAGNDCDRERRYQLLDWRTTAAGRKEGRKEGGRKKGME